MNKCDSKMLYLHIGTHKTGTTSVQSFLWENREYLRSLGMDYPRVGLSGITHARFVNELYFPRRERAMKALSKSFNWDNSPYRDIDRDSRVSVYSELKDYVMNSQCSNFVMSSECFYEWTEPIEFSNRLGKIFEHMYVIIYLRPQWSWIDAIYNQLIKDNYFRYTGKISELPQLELLNYYEILDEWGQAFGENNIIVRPFKIGNKFNVIKDLMEQLKLGEASKMIPSGLSIFENRRVPREYVPLLKEINEFPISDVNRKLLLDILVSQNPKTEDQQALEVDSDIFIEWTNIDNTKLFRRYFNGHNPWLI